MVPENPQTTMQPRLPNYQTILKDFTRDDDPNSLPVSKLRHGSWRKLTNQGK